MGWIANLRRPSRIKEICRICKIDEVLLDELKSVQAVHLTTVAKTAKRLGETERWAFPLILNHLIKDPDSARRLAEAPSGKLPGEVNRLVESRATEVSRPAIDELRPTIPPSCQIDEQKVLFATIALMRDGTAPDQFCRSITERVRSEPQTYVTGYSDWLDESARKVYESCQAVLTYWIPQGAAVDVEKCVQAIRKMLDGKLTVEGVAAAFIEAIGENPIQYINAPEAWFKGHAEAAFTALSPTLSQGLPEGCVLNREVCIKTLVESVKSGMLGNKLADIFVDKVRQRPEYFVDGLSEFFDKRAAEMFDQISAALSEQLPPDCFNRDACVSLVRSLMEDRTKPEEMMQKFAERVKSDQSKYLRIKPRSSVVRSSAPDHRVRSSPAGAAVDRAPVHFDASELFDQIDQQASSGLPSGFEFNREACIPLLENLVGKGTKPQKLVEEFFQRVASMPDVFLRRK